MADSYIRRLVLVSEDLLEIRNSALPALDAMTGDAGAVLRDSFEAAWGRAYSQVEFLLEVESHIDNAATIPEIPADREKAPDDVVRNTAVRGGRGDRKRGVVAPRLRTAQRG